ncbi:MAG: phage baseplate assembly protein V [Acidimicrobiia bacterium]|nr:phage baseplate assembly protein V [Acidimicrobiia bacterium]
MSLPPDHHSTSGLGRLYHGLYPATVTALEGDPEDRRRIEVALDWLATDDDEPPRAWAVVITPYADAEQGFQMLPEVDSTVVIGFLAGHLDHPYVVGAVWNGNAAEPLPFEDVNNKRIIQTRSGSRLEFDDTDGSVAVRLSAAGDAEGSVHKLIMDDAGQSITIEAPTGAKIELTAAGGITIEAASTVDVSAAMLTVDAPISQFNGIVKCDTLIASSGVVSPSYTPGAGNVW